MKEKIASVLCDELELKRIDDDEATIWEKLEKYNLITKNQLIQSPSVLKSYVESSMSHEKAELATTTDTTRLGFDSSRYFSLLKTRKFGTALLFAELVESTMVTLKE